MLRDAGLDYVNLTGASLMNAILRDANLIRTNLVEADLTEAELCQARIWNADFSRAIMTKVDLDGADIRRSRFTGTFLTGANMGGARLYSSEFAGADLRKSVLGEASLNAVDLSGADLRGAALVTASLVKTNLTRANLSGCRIYGVSAWDLKTEGAIQKDLLMSDFHQPDILVDSIEVAKFIYLLRDNQKLGQVIDTITTKIVLILGRFTDERKIILDGLRSELGKSGWVPVMFDFPPPQTRDFMETISTLAHLSRFVFADITDPTSVREELRIIADRLSSVPVQPLLESSSSVYYNFSDFKNCPWVQEVIRYSDLADLVKMLPDIIGPLEAKAHELTTRPKQTPQN